MSHPEGKDASISMLQLGWEVNTDSHPMYWLGEHPKPGLQPPEALVRIPADVLGTHTVIIAKSGSGKSFFLGRLVEELLLGTKANCLIFDPNADFSRISETERAAMWRRAKYFIKRKSGWLPTEAKKSDFEVRWKPIEKVIQTLRPRAGSEYEKIDIWWPSISYQFLAEDLDPMRKAGIYYCHKFVNSLAYLSVERKKVTDTRLDFITRAEKLLGPKLKPDIQNILQEEYVKVILAKAKRDDFYPYLVDEVQRNLSEAVQAAKYISSETRTFYFEKAHEYEAGGIIATESPRRLSRQRKTRVRVLNLPSLGERTSQLLVVDTTLASLMSLARRRWELAVRRPKERDSRVPNFIVVDEAHNLIPAQPEGPLEMVLRDKFRTIAAEGRKYGLFLILVSQRPDKLDPFITAECENKAIMQIDTSSIDTLRDNLGLKDERLLTKCVSFAPGRVLLLGRWSPEPRILYGAARRTVEGGRNLRPEYWATPFSDEKGR